jgi:hypothetical protein
MLFRCLAIENPGISFSYICPGTIEGNFRASAVDGGDVREQVSSPKNRLPRLFVTLTSEEVRSLPCDFNIPGNFTECFLLGGETVY